MLVLLSVRVNMAPESQAPIADGESEADAVTVTARVAVADAEAYVDDSQSGRVAEFPSPPHAQYALTEFVRAPQLIACAVTVSTAVLPTPRPSISHVVCPEFAPPSAPPVEDA